MLKNTFCHIQGVSAATEKLLWDSGVRHWDDFLEKYDTLNCLSKSKLEKIKDELINSKNALDKRDLEYFKTQLNSKEHWRLSNLGKIAFVDIETTGLSKVTDEITVLGIYDGVESYIFVNGKNLKDAAAKLQEFDIVVTFNGKQFDLPFIEHYFGCSYDFIHLDLRYMLKELGLQGGLKSIERQLGIARDNDMHHIDGFEAVNLWYRYKCGNQEALQTLLKYNEFDIVNLKTLLEYYLAKKHEQLTIF